MPSERCHICWNLDRYCTCDDLRHEADYVSDERMELTLEEAHGMGMDLEEAGRQTSQMPTRSPSSL